MVSRIIDTVNGRLLRHEGELSIAFVAILFLYFLVYLLSLSIQYADTDLWYHLTGGRAFFNEGVLYNPMVNSYLVADSNLSADNTSRFINYFWGFQALVYAAWSLAGEFGLILLKAVLFLVSGLFISKIILEQGTLRDTRFLQLFVLAIIIGLLSIRGFSLRPHVASYAMIPLFIYILGYREKLYPVLPVLTVIWVNLHGVEYVIGALICGSYFLQRLADYATERKVDAHKPLIWIALCLPAMMLNPNHLYILSTPFLHDPDLGLFIKELGPLGLEATIDLRNGFTLNTLVSVLLVISSISMIICLSQPREHIAALLIAIGGLVLLIMAKRFIWEWALLSTPVIAAALRTHRGPALTVAPASVLIVILLLLPLTYWPGIRHGWQHYPFDQDSLPYGTTRFIEKTGLTGKYAVAPSYAGYVEFLLEPGVKVHMDMQFPPFTSMDIHEINAAMQSPGGLATYIQKYEPDMLGVRKTSRHFPEEMAIALGYVPVFFDQKIALYLSREKHPEVTSRYGMQVINPLNESVLRQGNVDQAVAEFERMLSIVDTTDVKLTLTGLLVEQGRLAKATVYLDELQQSAPDDLSTIYYAARVAHLNNDCGNAVIQYERAMKQSAENPSMHRFAGECYFLLGDQINAYRHFRQALNPYKDANPEPLFYFQYALAAVGAGETETAIRLLRMIQRFAPDSELQPQINEMLASLENDS